MNGGSLIVGTIRVIIQDGGDGRDGLRVWTEVTSGDGGEKTLSGHKSGSCE